MNRLEFLLSTEMTALGALLAALNQHGVSYTLRKDSISIEVTIGRGF